jgi:hypothetical protein
MKTIEEQQAIATEVIGRLRIISPHVLLAGGAPRDWYMGNPCNDLDIYINIDDHISIENTRWRLNSVLGIDNVKTLSESRGYETSDFLDELYKGHKKLKRVWEFDYKGIKVQINDIDVNVSRPFNVVETFDSTICEFYFDPLQGTSIPSTAARITVDTKMNFVKDYNPQQKTRHLVKLLQRFPEYKVLPYTYFDGIQYVIKNKINIEYT